MKTTIIFAAALTLVLLAGAANSGPLKGRHSLEVRLGIWNHNHQQGIETNYGSRGSSLDASGFTGSLCYGYSLTEALAVNVSAGLRSAGIESGVNQTAVRLEAAAVHYVLVGVKYYLPRSSFNSPIRPYLVGRIGPYVGSQTLVQNGAPSEFRNNTETTVGTHLGAGVDLLWGSHVAVGVGLGYHLMADFDSLIGGFANYNGPVMTIGIGYLFGHGRE